MLPEAPLHQGRGLPKGTEEPNTALVEVTVCEILGGESGLFRQQIFREEGKCCSCTRQGEPRGTGSKFVIHEQSWDSSFAVTEPRAGRKTMMCDYSKEQCSCKNSG